MADPLRITVNSPTADVNPFADVVGDVFAQPVQVNPRERDLLIRTVFGEADGKDEEGRAAVANVIRNRIASGKYGTGAEGVIKKPWAFEPWMRADARERMLSLREDDPNYQSIAQIVDKVLSGSVKDNTGGATHFFAPRAQAQLGRNVPAWAVDKPALANIGGHLFYAPEGAVRGTPSSPGSSRGGVEPVAGPTPPSIQPGDANAAVTLASNKITPGNPFASDASPLQTVAPPTATAKQPLPPEMKTPVSQGDAFATGVEQGVSFGWADELRGIDAALGASIPQGSGGMLMAAIGIAQQAWGNYQTNPNDQTMAAYKKAVEAARKLYAQSKEQHPWTTFGGELAGSAIVPLPVGGGPAAGVVTAVGRNAMQTGRPAMSRVGSSIMQGSTAGALAGGGSAEGDISQRVGPALIGAGGGAGIGAVVAGAAPAFANYIGGAIMDAAAPARRAVQKIANLAIDAGRTNPKNRIMPGQQTAETMVADMLGEPGRGAARAVHNMSDVASDIMKEATEVRASGQYRRLLDWLESKFGALGDNEMAKLRVRAEQAQVTTPLYQAVLQQYSQGVMPPRLIGLIDQHPTLRGAAEEALQSIRERAAVRGNPAPGVDSLEFWDQVKRNIQGKIDWTAAQPGSSKTGEPGALKELQSVIINELDNVTGGPKGPYAHARATSEAYFDINGAIKEGQRFIKSNQFTTEQAVNAMKGMSPDAQEAFKKAAVSQMLDKFGGVKDSHNLWKGINHSPDAQAKLKFLFNGDQKAIDKFEAMQHVENLHERLREAVRGNSTTVKQYLTAAALGGSGSGIGYLTGTGTMDPTTPGGAALWSGAALGARRFANQRMAEHLATMLVSRDPAILQQAINAAAGDVRMLNMLRSMVENAASRAAGSSVGRSIGD